MNEVQVFNFEQKEVRTVLIKNEAWFVGKDVAQALGYQDTPKAIKQHVDQDDRLTLTGQNAHLENLPNRGVVGVNESGVYSLIFGSKLDSAKRFKKWVTSEVLPSIRHTGGYKIDRSDMTDILVKAISSMNERIHALENTTITSGQEKAFNNIKKQRIIWVIGGTYRYKELSRTVSRAIMRDVFTTYGISRLDELKSKDFDAAYNFVKNWEPQGKLVKKIGYAVYKRIRERNGVFSQWS
ncbi:BRO family protein [Leuconostoc falkenbergense]|uniref:BRO family protein n=1 Tax=Leuconostoc falkenbergense TaxID=2766470 RepID=UPI0021AA783D|nr:BRO family protein [Leuconostoc falkenbergense]MCT4389764.1 toxin Bro [Leuconostoc falkenbergense]